MTEIRKHCDTCNYSFLRKDKNTAAESGFIKAQHCSNDIYNSPAYTHEMLMEDWDKGYCRLWEPRALKEKYMKNSYSIAQRNEIVEANLWRIDKVMEQYRKQIRINRMDREDVYQQLALRLIRAVENYDSGKGKLSQHINAQLRFELLECKCPVRLYGVTDAPGDFKRDNVISFDVIREACVMEHGMGEAVAA